MVSTSTYKATKLLLLLEHQVSLTFLFIGCGKSSVISLIERFYDPIDGNLFYNDVNLKDIDNVWYH